MKTLIAAAIVTVALGGVANAEGRYEATSDASNGVRVLDTKTGEVGACMVLRGDKTVSCTPWTKSEKAVG